MKCKASLWSVKTDHEGEVSIAFKIPQTEAPNVMNLTQWTEQLLDLTIELSDERVNNEEPSEQISEL